MKMGGVLRACFVLLLITDTVHSRGQCRNADSSDQSIQHHQTQVMHRYDQNPPPFSLCFGRPMHAMPHGQKKALLIYFSALTCPRCAFFHVHHLDFLMAMARTKNLRLVMRDYPIDGLSLRGSACVWSPTLCASKRKALFAALFRSQKEWMTGNAQDLEKIKNKIITCANIRDTNTQRDIEKSHQDTSKTSIMQSLFEAHNTDQKMFGIQSVPFAVLVMRDENGENTMQKFDTPNMDQDIVQSINHWLK